jgi:hypothetical protein
MEYFTFLRDFYPEVTFMATNFLGLELNFNVEYGAESSIVGIKHKVTSG